MAEYFKGDIWIGGNGNSTGKAVLPAQLEVYDGKRWLLYVDVLAERDDFAEALKPFAEFGRKHSYSWDLSRALTELSIDDFRRASNLI